MCRKHDLKVSDTRPMSAEHKKTGQDDWFYPVILSGCMKPSDEDYKTQITSERLCQGIADVNRRVANSYVL